MAITAKNDDQHFVKYISEKSELQTVKEETNCQWYILVNIVSVVMYA